ncbi:hypothetical protein L7F22_012293 [Adiantum nelumboides]|nr:hypothetical protein [Adiantum nelumboides]
MIRPVEGSEAAGSSTPLSALDQENPTPAPIVLATLPPSAREQVQPQTQQQQRGRSSHDPTSSSSSIDPQERSSSPKPTSFGFLQLGCVIKLLDATLRYGYLPPQCMDLITRALCRILGFQSTNRDQKRSGSSSSFAAPSPLDSSQDEKSWESEVWPVMSNILRSHCANSALRSVRRLLAEPASSNASSSTDLDLEDRNLRTLHQ